MIIKEINKIPSDFNNKLIKKGLADLVIYSLIFDRYFTEEEIEDNRTQSHILDEEDYTKRCESCSYEIYTQMYPIMDIIDGKYNLHQYKEETCSMDHYRSDWDLYFYSNRGWNGRDYYDYVVISLNEKRPIGDNQKLTDELLGMLKSIDVKNISCRVQYTVKIHGEELHALSNTICEKLLGQFIDYEGMTGKIKLVNEFEGVKYYGFFKKGARNTYYKIDDASLVLQHAG